MRSIGGWTIEGALGRGARGTVLRGRGPAGEAVAVKLVQGDGEVRERFAREAAALARVRHPNVVGVRDHGEAQGQLFLVMDLVEGEPLGGILSRQGPLTPRAAATLCLTLARALEQVHAAGLLHRDLKPDNVVVRGTGEPVLVDFGLARDALRGSLTQSGVLLGTPGFMSPEQAAGARADARADVYGLGATLYAALTGRAPHEGDSLPELLVATARAAPPAPSSRVAGASGPGWPELDQLVLRCLEKEPARRFQTAGALADALEGWLRGRRNAQRRRRPRPLVVGSLLLGCGLSLSALVLFVVTQPGPRPPAVGVAAPTSAGPAPASTEVATETAPAADDDDRRRRARALLDQALACDQDDVGLAAAFDLARQALALAPELGRARGLAALFLANRTKSRADQEAALGALDAAATAPAPWLGREPDRERGLLLQTLGRNAEASRILAPLLRALPDDARLAWSLGVAARASDQPELAIEAFEQVVRLHGERSRGWPLPFNLAGALASLPHRMTEAVPHYALAVELFGGDGGIASLRRAQLLSSLVRPEEALVVCEGARSLGGKERLELEHVRVVCLTRLNRLTDALEAAQALHDRRPSPSHATQLALVTYVAGDAPRAVAILEAALAREDSPGVRGLLKEVREVAAPDDAADEAVSIYEKRLRLRPEARDDAVILSDVLDVARSSCPAATRAFFCEREVGPRWAHRMSTLLIRVGLGQSGPDLASARAATLVAAARCQWALEDRCGAFGLLDRAAREAPDDVQTKIARAELSLAVFDLRGAAGLLEVPRLSVTASTDPLLLRAARMRVLLAALLEAEKGRAADALAAVDALLKGARDDPLGDEPGWRAFLLQARARLEAAR